MRPDKRMEAIAGAVPACRTVCDVGSDHGLIPLLLLERGVCERAVVTDISAESLGKAVALLTERGMSDRAAFVCCDGLTAVEERPDAVIIAGMGGQETVKILRQAREKLPDRLILQPMRNVPEVRRAVVELGFHIQSDRVVLSRGKYYSVLSLDRGDDRLTALEERFGRSDLQSPTPDFMRWLECQQVKAKRILAGSDKEPAAWREYLEQIEYARMRCQMRAALSEGEQ